MGMNANLGNFDMVLALSINKINSQFIDLYKQGKLPNKCQFLCSDSGMQFVEGESFKSQSAEWLKFVALNQSLSDCKAKLKAINKTEDPSGFNGLKAESTRLRNEIEDYDEAVTDYNICMDANILPPTIKLDGETVYFTFNFASGVLTWLKAPGSEVVLINLKDISCSFEVKINSRELKPQDDEVIAKFDPSKFRVESIFLEISAKNLIGSFSIESQKPNVQIAQITLPLQTALSNYFIKSGSEGYILGEVKRPCVAEPNALLDPIRVENSISPSGLHKASAFNFLMLVNGGLRDADLNRHLPASLIEKAANIREVNGVIAVDFDAFNRVYYSSYVVDKVEQALKSSLEKVMRKQAFDITFNGSLKNEGQITAQMVKHNYWLTYKVTKRLDFVKENRSLLTSYQIEVDGGTHQEVENKKGIFILVDRIKSSTTGVILNLSSRPDYQRLNDSAENPTHGNLNVFITAGSDGKLSVNVDYQKPVLGKDPQGFKADKDIDKVALSLQGIGSHDIGLGDNSDLHFSIDQLEELIDYSDIVVLPGSSTYTFKDIRLLNNTKDKSDAVLFDITYAPKNSQ